jgi:hypothetical protein
MVRTSESELQDVSRKSPGSGSQVGRPLTLSGCEHFAIVRPKAARQDRSQQTLQPDDVTGLVRH